MKKYLFLIAVASVVFSLVGCSDQKNMHFSSISNLKLIGLALTMYADDNAENFPAPVALGKNKRPDAVAGLDVLIYNGYLEDLKVYVTRYDSMGKAAVDDGSFDPVENCSYAYFGRGVKSGAVSADFPLAIEKPWRLPSVNTNVAVLFADGSVRSVEIPNANRKSCREVAEILITRGSLQEKEKKLLRENAALADELR